MHTTKCPTCGRENRIVNECRCDPNNLPTRIVEQDQRRYDQRIERFSLAVFRELIRVRMPPERDPRVDYVPLAAEAVRAARELDDAIYPQDVAMPDYIP